MGLVGAVRGGRVVAREGEVDDLDDPLVLGHVFGGVVVADGGVGGGIGVRNVGFKGELDVASQGEEVALVLGEGEGKEGEDGEEGELR